MISACVVNIAFAGTPGIEHNVQSFLDALNSGTGKPLEALSPQDARSVLVGGASRGKSDVA